MVITMQGNENTVCRLEGPNDLYRYSDELKQSLSLILESKQPEIKESTEQ